MFFLKHRLFGWAVYAAIILGVVVSASSARAHDPLRAVRITSGYDFQTTLRILQDAIRANRMAVVNKANAQSGALSIRVSIPGNQVWGVFAPEFAVRMLRAHPDAGIEAPIRLYIAEDRARRVTVSYQTPTDIFAPYVNRELDLMARELDLIFERIVAGVRPPSPQRRMERQRELPRRDARRRPDYRGRR